jgi:NAD(P)-dependent dehydrogenase (short-subunit alcohol dehydrogenase family)
VSGVLEMSTEEMDLQIDVNLKGPFHFVRHVAPGMKERHFGRIINISSSGGVRPFAYLSHYVAAKAGLIMAGRSWAQEFGEYGITVNAIAPGVLRTPMNDHVLALLDMELDAGYEEWMTRNVFRGEENPLTMDDVSRAIVYLASEDGRAITGQTIAVDSGWTIT